MLASLFTVLVISALFLVIDVRSEECGKSPVILAEEGKAVNATEGSWPWMVAIVRTEGSHRRVICDGFLIDDIHLLSSARCFEDKEKPTDLELWTEQFSALIGSVNQDEAEEYYIGSITKHVDYKRGQHYNDIAIVKLSVRVAFPGFNPVCLEEIMTSELLTDIKATEVGWNNFGSVKNLKQLSGFQFMSNSDCRSIYRDTPDFTTLILPRGFIDTILCAVTPNTNYGCVGMSGSPMMIMNRGRWSAVGLRSFSYLCMSDMPGGYTRLTPYLDWIKKNTSRK